MSRMRLNRTGRMVRWLPSTVVAPLPLPATSEAAAPTTELEPFDLPDPATMTVAEALAWIEANPEHAEALQALEADGKARKTILRA